MSVTGKDEVCSICRHAINDSQIGGMRDSKRQISRGIEFTSDIVISIPANVWVVDTTNIHVASVHRQRTTSIGEVKPAGVDKTINEVLPGEHLSVRFQARGAKQIPGRVDGLGCVIVVATEHECAGYIKERLKGVQHVRHRQHVGQEVSGGDDGIGLKLTQGTHPLLLAHLTGHEMQVAEVENAKRRLPRGKCSDSQRA